MFESGNKARSTYPSYKFFYKIKEIIKEISYKNGLYLDMKHNSTEFTTIYSNKYEPTMAIYYTDNSKKCSKEDGIYVYIMYPNKELKKITISIELGYSKRFKNKDDMYEKCIRNIENFYDSFIEDDEIIDGKKIIAVCYIDTKTFILESDNYWKRKLDDILKQINETYIKVEKYNK